MGAHPDYTWRNISPTPEEMKETEKKILKASDALKKPHVLFVYAGGHGATANEKQIFLLNTKDA